MKKFLPYLLAVVIVGLLILIVNSIVKNIAADGLAKKGVAINDLPKPDQVKVDTKDNLIKVTEPAAGAVIVSPLIIKGQARGYWFFEAVFPIQLLDSQGRIVTTTQARAKSDWLTDDFVDFEAELDFKGAGDKQGKLILKKDNPSGQAIMDDQLVIPVRY